MPKEEITDLLNLMLESARLVEERFLNLRSPDDFIESPEGMTLLDAVSMRLQVIGEAVRKIQKSDPNFLAEHSGIEWDKIARFRDLVSHHYNQVDHEIVYDICKVHIPKLKKAIQKILS